MAQVLTIRRMAIELKDASKGQQTVIDAQVDDRSEGETEPPNPWGNPSFLGGFQVKRTY